MAAGITTAGENEFSFRHQLLRRAVGDMIPQPARKALHRQYGQILLNRGESAALAASHLLQAADPGNPASLADLDAAAEQTLRSAPQTAADLLYLETVDDECAAAGPACRSEVDRRLAKARRLSMEW